jgi:protein-S-isoprenylcysteine O-methyltransferase Ste14
MTSMAIFGWLLFAALAFALRSWIHWRQTGRTGWVGLSGRPGSIEWIGGMLFAVGCAAGPIAPLIGPRWTAMPAVGLPLYLVGLVGTLWAQLSMGTSWRIGVDESDRTALVTRGPFRWVRNPIFTAMVFATTGLGLLVPNLASIAAVAAIVLAVELHVRVVEEPYLVRTHGAPYRTWASHTGRFLPLVGRLPSGRLDAAGTL